jgi:hypothetical protein
MTLHDTIQADAASVFCNVNDFAEAVTYYKRNGLSRVINAVVVRENFVSIGDTSDSIVPVLEVHVANNSTTGISSDELDAGSDRIEVAMRVGQPATLRSIVRLRAHDEGLIVLQCR